MKNALYAEVLQALDQNFKLCDSDHNFSIEKLPARTNKSNEMSPTKQTGCEPFLR